MLFLLDAAGVPSVASIMAIDNNACAASLTLSQTTVTQGDCYQTLRFTVSSPVNAQTNYRWTVNGTYVPASDGSATLTWATDSDDPTAAVQVEATRACAGSTVSATRTVTSYFPNCGGGVR